MRNTYYSGELPPIGDKHEDQALRGSDGHYLPRDNDRDINPRSYEPAGRTSLNQTRDHSDRWCTNQSHLISACTHGVTVLEAITRTSLALLAPTITAA